MKTKIMHKGMVQKIAIAIIIVVLLNFAIPIKSNAVLSVSSVSASNVITYFIFGNVS